MPKQWYLIIVAAVPALILIQSSFQKNQKKYATVFALNDSWKYDMSAPTQVNDLPEVLREISGLSYISNDLLLAIEDEHGIYYKISTSGEILEQKQFEHKEDYEGIEWINDTLMAAVNSKGDVYCIKTVGDNLSCTVINTSLKRDDDVEGLGLNSDKTALLLSAKAHSKNGYKKRRIYQFDISEMELVEEPLIKISNDSLWHFMGKQKKRNFSPSALAYNAPDFILLSSADHLIARIDTDGNTISAARLDPAIYEQPEGLAIGPNGSLYISSEGQNASAKLFRLEPMQ